MIRVVIPIYKADFSEIEKVSFEQCLAILGQYEIVIAHPENLDVSDILNKHNLKGVSFPDFYFAGISGYNKLMMSRIFYDRFKDCKYILIYQLDCYVFRDELLYWCSTNYDYIGAPWIVTPKNNIISKINRFFGKGKDKDDIYYKTGNGGFSLRKVESFLKVIDEYGDILAKYNQNEDLFWSLEAPKLAGLAGFLIPDYMESVKFAIDRKPKIAFKLINNQLPFGCHGINKPKVIKFWGKIIKF